MRIALLFVSFYITFAPRQITMQHHTTPHNAIQKTPYKKSTEIPKAKTPDLIKKSHLSRPR